jgi:hypothetical protein
MHDIKIWIEDHPYLAGSVALGVIVLWLLWRRASAAAAPQPQASGSPYIAGADPTLAALALQSGTQLQSYEIAAALQSQQSSDALAAQQLAAQVQTTQSQLDYQKNLAEILAAAQSTSDTTAAQLQLGLATVLAGGGVSGTQTTTTVYGQTQLQAQQQQQQQQQTAVINAVTPPPPVVVTPPPPVYTPPPVYVPPVTQPATYTVPPPQAGQTWNTYYSSVLASDPAVQGYLFDPARVDAQTAAFADAQNAWISDPNSPHNIPPGCWRDSSGALQCP